MYSALDIAAWFIIKNQTEQNENLIDSDDYEVYEGITHLKLQKLLYYAQGIYLALHEGKPLFRENICAWTHGPVIPEVYHIFSSFGRKNIVLPITDEVIKKIKNIELDNDAQEALNLTYDNFAGYTAWYLRNETHKIGSPWSQIAGRDGSGLNEIIPNKIIEKYFKENIVEL